VSDGDEYKQCPDCAERVLAAARKCRYCGYRFDTERRKGGSVLASMIPGVIRPSRETTMPEILADWGVKLGESENVEFFLLAAVDEQNGYLLVTSQRLIFFAQTSRREHEKRIEYPLASISGVHLTGSRVRPRLELRGPDTRHVVQGIVPADTRRLDIYLAEHSVGNLSGDNATDRPPDQW
jgi:hypothetical protein